jgi:hypothetical protein
MWLNIFPNRQCTLVMSDMKPRLVVIVTSLQELQNCGVLLAVWHIRDSIELEADAFVLVCVAGGVTNLGFEPPRLQKVSKTILEANHTVCKAEDVS